MSTLQDPPKSGAPQLTAQELAKLIDSGEAKLLSAVEITNRKKTGDIPAKFELTPGIGVYCIKKDKEYLMITNILCPNCKRLDNNKVARCAEHKKKHKKGKKGMGQDDDSDREKLGGLRHVDDDEEDEKDTKIENAVTPDKVMTVGPGGVPVVTVVPNTNNPKVGPRATNLHHVKGILVKGAGDIPQFIPNDKLTNEQKLKFENYVTGEMILDEKKQEVFIPEGFNPAALKGTNVGEEAAAAVAGDAADKDIMKVVGEGAAGAIPVLAETAENGMVMYKVTPEGVKDKNIPAGVLLKQDGQIYFVQVAGKELGGGKNAPLVPSHPDNIENLRVGDHVADVVLGENGKPIAVKPGEAGKRKIIGKIVVGNKKQYVFTPAGQDVKESVGAQEKFLSPENVEKLNIAEIKVHAKVTGQSEDYVRQKLEDLQKKSTGAFNNGQADGAGGANGGAGGVNGGAGGGYGGSGGEINSVAFNQQYGGSQFARAVPMGNGIPGARGGGTGGYAGGAAGGYGGAGGYRGASGGAGAGGGAGGYGGAGGHGSAGGGAGGHGGASGAAGGGAGGAAGGVAAGRAGGSSGGAGGNSEVNSTFLNDQQFGKSTYMRNKSTTPIPANNKVIQRGPQGEVKSTFLGK